MSTAKQAMESMEYMRSLLEEKQAGFAASVELALSFYPPSDRVAGGNDGTDAAACTPRDHREARPGARVARGPAGAPGRPLAGGRSGRRPCRLAPDGGAGAAGLPSVARTPHPPLMQASD